MGSIGSLRRNLGRVVAEAPSPHTQALTIIAGRFLFLCGPALAFDDLRDACGPKHIVFCIDEDLVSAGLHDVRAFADPGPGRLKV